VNGQSLAVEPRPGIEPEAPELSDLRYNRWYTWQLNLGPGETARVRNTYWVTNTFDSIGGQQVNYILRTGSVWQDKIEKAELTISILGTPPYLNQLSCPDYSYLPTSVEIKGDRTIIRYILRELEPDRDINLYFLPGSALVLVYQQDPGPLGELARAYAGRDFQRSAELAEKMMAAAPQPWVKGELVQLQGSSLYLIGQWERARSCFEAAGENDPAAALYLALIARGLGDARYEEKALLKLKQLTSSSYNLYNLWAGMRYQELLAPVLEENRFPDLAGHWSEPLVQLAAARGLLEAGADFRPVDPVTQGDFLKMLSQVSSVDQRAADPSAPVRREEAAVLVTRAIGGEPAAQRMSGVILSFADGQSVAEENRPYLQVAYSRGLLRGYPDGTFRGEAPLTRAEAAAMLMRVAELLGTAPPLL
ncbi:MAG: S-layer homology domain-containing protein, partial [Syntrophomonadaceae bacterium]|nr:S-layer homology domain-containing protein [Syntrophomonadaceae bacterium]